MAAKSRTTNAEIRDPKRHELEIIRSLWVESVLHDPIDSWERSFENIVFPTKAEGRSFVAVLNDKIIGFSSTIDGSLRALCTAEAHRRAGVGDALLAEVTSVAKNKEWDSLWARTPDNWVGSVIGVNQEHKDAIPFLEKRGFTKGNILTHVEADFEDVELAARMDPIDPVASVSEYEPSQLGDMKAFVKHLGMDRWVWHDWVEQFSRSDPGFVRLVARIDGQLVGCVDSSFRPGGWGGINYIRVDEAHYRKKIGSHLLREVSSILKERGAASLFAGLVPPGFYLKNGWRIQRQFVAMVRTMKRQ